MAGDFAYWNHAAIVQKFSATNLKQKLPTYIWAQLSPNLI